MAVRAVLWEKDRTNASSIRCVACAHYCRIAENSVGRCRVRVHQDGTLHSLSAGTVAAANFDPIEKKPLFHFLPGSLSLSLGTPGCNMTCSFCQNHSLSQGATPVMAGASELFPDDAASAFAFSAKENGAKSISFTYNEPSVSPELITAVAPRANALGLANILVSNAFESRESMVVYRDMIQAASFDVKAFSDDFYRNLCGARLSPVLKTIVLAASFGWWVEIVTLLIPGYNDSDKELAALARFIKEEIGAHVPWHISRFRPMFKLKDAPPTPTSSLERAYAVGIAEGLQFVYIGNAHGHDGENTLCPGCGEVFIRRTGYRVCAPNSGVCEACGESIPGVWSKI